MLRPPMAQSPVWIAQIAALTAFLLLLAGPLAYVIDLRRGGKFGPRWADVIAVTFWLRVGACACVECAGLAWTYLLFTLPVDFQRAIENSPLAVQEHWRGTGSGIWAGIVTWCLVGAIAYALLSLISERIADGMARGVERGQVPLTRRPEKWRFQTVLSTLMAFGLGASSIVRYFGVSHKPLPELVLTGTTLLLAPIPVFLSLWRRYMLDVFKSEHIASAREMVGKL